MESQTSLTRCSADQTIETDDYKSIEAKLLQCIDVESLMQCDRNMSEVFVKTFYSLSHDTTKIQSGHPGIVTSFLRHWSSTRGVGNLAKVLPTVLTGR